MKPHWHWVSRKRCGSVGGKITQSTGIVVAPLKLVHSGAVKLVCCIVTDFHKVIDILFGLDFQFTHSCVFDPSNFRVYGRLAKEAIRLDYIGKVKTRLIVAPTCIHFLSLCDGIATPYGMAPKMGFKVAKYFAFEKAELCQSVAKSIYSDIVHLAPHDFLLVSDFKWLIDLLHDENIVHLAWTAGLPCTHWSGLSDNPLGFKYTLAQLVVRGAALLSVLRKENLIWTILNEIVVPHENLVDDLFTLEQLMRVIYIMHNSVDSGATANHPRLLGLEGATVANMLVSTHIQPAFVLKPMWTFSRSLVPCLIASGGDTRSPIWLSSPRQPNRHPDGDERDRMNQGSPASASTGYGSVPLSLKQRQRITRNAFSDDMLWTVMFQWVIPTPLTASTMISQPTPRYTMSPEDCQMTLSLLTAPEMFALLSTMIEPDFMPRIPIFVKEGRGIIPFQTRAPGTVPVKLQASAVGTNDMSTTKEGDIGISLVMSESKYR